LAAVEGSRALQLTGRGERELLPLLAAAA
jgi:hypothetical protein